MTRILLIIIVSAMLIISFNYDAQAEEVILCIDVTDEEVTLMNARGNCFEGEKEFVYGGPGAKLQDAIIPLVNVSPNQNCETEGNRIEIGFDRDDDGILDPEEIVSISQDCKLSAEGE